MTKLPALLFLSVPLSIYTMDKLAISAAQSGQPHSLKEELRLLSHDLFPQPQASANKQENSLELKRLQEILEAKEQELDVLPRKFHAELNWHKRFRKEEHRRSNITVSSIAGSFYFVCLMAHAIKDQILAEQGANWSYWSLIPFYNNFLGTISYESYAVTQIMHDSNTDEH
ncbi:MAG: hypothetical protein AB7F19_05465 [Candidatus Babeliales bacterium]